MQIKERLEQLRGMDFNDKTKKDLMEESVMGNIMEIDKEHPLRPTCEICYELMIANAKMHRRSLISKSEYNSRRNEIEKILFNR